MRVTKIRRKMTTMMHDDDGDDDEACKVAMVVSCPVVIYVWPVQ